MKRVTFTTDNQSVKTILALILDNVVDINIADLPDNEPASAPEKIEGDPNSHVSRADRMRISRGTTIRQVIRGLFMETQGPVHQGAMVKALVDNGFKASSLPSMVSNMLRNREIQQHNSKGYYVRDIAFGGK